MKKNIYGSLVLLTILTLTVNVFTKSKYLTPIIIFSSNLFIKNIFPSLFPMFIISSILVEIGLPEFLGSIFYKPFKTLFKANKVSSFVFFMSMLTGFPSSAKMIDDLIDKNMISNKDAEKILMFTFFSNPLFIINTVGNTFLHSKTIGIKIFICHLLGNIITGVFFRAFNNNKDCNIKREVFSFNDLLSKTNEVSLFKVLLNSIKKALDIMINIFGIVTFFLILTNILFKNPNTFYEVFITGIIEMTSGLKYLSISDMSLSIKGIISVFFISFGGLSVHAQIMDILKEKKVKYLPFLIARIIHSITSVILFIILL